MGRGLKVHVYLSNPEAVRIWHAMKQAKINVSERIQKYFLTFAHDPTDPIHQEYLALCIRELERQKQVLEEKIISAKKKLQVKI